MTEIDFEELDKAVNLLMKKDDNMDKQIKNNTNETDNNQDQMIERDLTPRRQAGRFMDIIPPAGSRNMSENKDNSATNLSEVEREAKEVNESFANLAKDQPKSAPANDLPKPEPKENQPETETKTAANLTPYASSWTGAKVEKRPLGEIEEDITPHRDNIGNQALRDSATVDNVNPPELRADILALESDAAVGVDREEISPEVHPASPTPKQTASTVGDIPRQYQSENTPSPEPSAIFDAASSSEQNIQHPAKKRSSWWIVLWIFLLILLGVVCGVVYFVFFRQNGFSL